MRDRQTERFIDRQTGRKANKRQAGIQIRQMGRETGGKPKRQTDRKTNNKFHRQAGRKAQDRQRQAERHTEGWTLKFIALKSLMEGAAVFFQWRASGERRTT